MKNQALISKRTRMLLEMCVLVGEKQICLHVAARREKMLGKPSVVRSCVGKGLLCRRMRRGREREMHLPMYYYTSTVERIL